MATVNAVTDFIRRWPDQIITVTWSGLANSDDGNKIEFPVYVDRSIQVVGTFGAGGTVALQGSNDGVTWATLNDPQGNPLAIDTSKIESIQELARYMRPLVTAGDGTTSLTVYLIMRRA